MTVCSSDVEVVVHGRCFFINVDFVCSGAGSRGNNLPSNPFLSSW